MNTLSADIAAGSRHFISRDNLRLHYFDLGPRADQKKTIPVLCLPGLTRNGRDFIPLAEHLVHERRVLILDGRGRGRSDYALRPSHYRAETDLDDVLQLLVAVGIDRTVAIGTSFGGAMVQALAAIRPTQLAGAVLNDIGPTVGWRAVTRLLDAFAGDRSVSDWNEAVVLMKRLVPELGLKTNEQWLEAAKGTWRETADGKLRVDFDLRLVRVWRRRGIGDHDLWSLWQAVNPIPTLLVRGAESEVLTAETAIKMRGVKPDLRIVEVPGVGHAPSLVEPDSLAAINAFLADVDRREAA